MIAVPTRQRRYRIADGNPIIVYMNQNDKVLPPMSGFQYAAAYSDRLDARRFVLGMRLDGHEFLTSVGGRRLLTACSGWLHR